MKRSASDVIKTTESEEGEFEHRQYTGPRQASSRQDGPSVEANIATDSPQAESCHSSGESPQHAPNANPGSSSVFIHSEINLSSPDDEEIMDLDGSLFSLEQDQSAAPAHGMTTLSGRIDHVIPTYDMAITDSVIDELENLFLTIEIPEQESLL